MIIFQIVLTFMALTFSLAGLVLGFNLVWRTKNRLVTFFKLISTALSFLALRQILTVLSIGRPRDWYNVFLVLDVGMLLFFMLGMWKIYQIVRHLDNEEPKN